MLENLKTAKPLGDAANDLGEALLHMAHALIAAKMWTPDVLPALTTQVIDGQMPGFELLNQVVNEGLDPAVANAKLAEHFPHLKDEDPTLNPDEGADCG